MQIQVNGKKDIIKDKENLAFFLKSKGIKEEYAIIELNGQIINKENIKNVILKENDILEILTLVGGG